MHDIIAVIFDLDGVITDTEDLHARIERETCAAFGISAPPALWDGFKGLREREIFSTLLAHAGRPDLSVDTLIRAKVARYLEAAEREAVLVPGADGFIRSCRERGYRIALTTSCLRVVADRILAKFRLDPYFDVRTTGEDVSHGKPHPEPYTLTVARLGLRPEQCAVIEDSDNGVRSARAAGCRVIGITTSFSASVLKDAGAASVIGRFSELDPLLPPRQSAG